MALCALLGVATAWVAAWGGPSGAVTAGTLAGALCLSAVSVATYRFPLHIRPKVKVYLASVPLYMLVALISPPLAATVGAAATLLGELSVRRERGNSADFIVTEVGRRALLLLAGGLVAHGALVDSGHIAAVILAAIVLEAGDIATAPLVLGPLTGDAPLARIASVARDAWAIEGAQYLLGLLGVLAVTQAVWAPALLVVPLALIYRALDRAQRARAAAEAARREAEAARAQAETVAHAMRRQALYDALTGLPNRALLHDRLAHALDHAQRGGAPVTFMLLDLDRFKEVNDTLGHQAGDSLLRQVAARVQRELRASDTVARLGGDEFAVLLPDTGEDGAVSTARKLHTALEAPFDVEEQQLHVGGSIGMAFYPEHGADAPTLLRHADVAMYVAKRSHHAYAVYDPTHDQYSPQRLALLGDLRRAIARGALLLHYQPKIDVATGHGCGVEALVRWPHPRHGLIPPDQFIPLAEQTGLIEPLMCWVLEEALRQSRVWRDAGLDLAISVNLSARNLHDPGLPETVARLLTTYAIPSAALCLEVTESALMADTARAMDVLARLRALGARIAVDDFGTGYSSLAYLKRLPVDELKIDKAFVQRLAEDATDVTLVDAIISLGHGLGLRVVAEGVETGAALDVLRCLRCDTVQGFHTGRPVPPEEVARQGGAPPWAWREDHDHTPLPSKITPAGKRGEAPTMVVSAPTPT